MRGYKRKFRVTVTLTPGVGYEDSLVPYEQTMLNAIRRAIENELHSGSYIAAKVTSVRRVDNVRRAH